VRLPWDELLDQATTVAKKYLGSSPKSAPSRSSFYVDAVVRYLERTLGSAYEMPTMQALARGLKAKFQAAMAQNAEMMERLALGDGVYERIYAVSLGYFIVGLALILYLYMLNMGTVKAAGRAVRNAVRQQLLILKVRAGVSPMQTVADLCKGHGVHRHRAVFVPARVRHQPGRVLNLDVPRGVARHAHCVLQTGADHVDILPLGTRDNVHV
jgi:hypothetical protein